MYHYYITPEDSETWKRFEELEKRHKESYAIITAFAIKVGGYSAFVDLMFSGKTTSIAFKEDKKPDPQLWRKIAEEGYVPKKTSEAGKQLLKEMNALPCMVTNDERNACVGYKADLNECIGVAKTDGHIGFMTCDGWEFTPPQDCEEVTKTRYDELFPPIAKK